MYTRNKMLENQWRNTERMHRRYVLKTSQLVKGQILDFREDLIEYAYREGQKIAVKNPNFDFENEWFTALAPLRTRERVAVRNALALEVAAAKIPKAA